MTEICYRNGKDFQELTLDGHAGDPIVCAGISAISQTLLKNLLREEEREQITLDWEMDEPGQLWMRAWPIAESRETIRKMFEFTMTGLKQTAEDYPGNITIKEEEGHGTV